MNTKVVDYLIVGQGLAGSCLAVQLLERKKKIAVIDLPVDQAASRVAAGLFNPITGKIFSLTWQADILFSYLHMFYQRAEKLTGQHFFYPMPVYRPFASAGEQNDWMIKSADNRYTPYLEQLTTSPIFESQVINPYGGLLLKQCGYLDTVKFLEAVRKLIVQQGTFLEDFFNEAELVICPDGVTYRNLKAARVIFCQGIAVNQNRFFSWLPIQPLKGEVLQLETDEEVTRIYNRGVYVVPGVWKAGATYNRFDGTPGITPDARKELTAALDLLVRFPYQIRNQLFGFRPTVPDRRPILGLHPEFNNLIVFNGLGTKGVSLAPYFSHHLVQWLENELALNNAVAIQRYKSLYWKSA
ncbi:MAG: FAD-binding oxidoreductase [Flammeovirgaceae bacterium]|nr:MAG: FAD-binding oxidoreductase [Flammeovirgaceae bacterium]